MNTLVVNGVPILSTMGGRQIRPEEQYNLTEMKRYLKDTLTNGVNKFISFADLINNPRSRTTENIFAIVERILELFNSMDAGIGGTSSIPVKIFSPKNPSGSLVGILGRDIKRYKNNPDLLLLDLDIFDAYYKKQSNQVKIINDRVSHATSQVMEKFHEAFEVVMRNEIRKDSSYGYIHFNEFEINKQGNIQFSEIASSKTRNIRDLIHKIQQVFDDLILLEK